MSIIVAASDRMKLLRAQRWVRKDGKTETTVHLPETDEETIRAFGEEHELAPQGPPFMIRRCYKTHGLLANTHLVGIFIG